MTGWTRARRSSAVNTDAFAATLRAGSEVRAALFDLDPRHTALVEAAGALGLPATYTGSGGAVSASRVIVRP